MKKLFVISGAAAGLMLSAAGCGTITSHTTAPTAKPSSSAAAPSPSTNPAYEQFAGDMRRAYEFQSDVVDSNMAKFADQVCGDLGTSRSIADEVPVVQGKWTNISEGDAINMITMAARDVCPEHQPNQTVTYIVTGSPADVTYGPSGSSYQGHVPMKITEPLGNPS